MACFDDLSDDILERIVANLAVKDTAHERGPIEELITDYEYHNPANYKGKGTAIPKPEGTFPGLDEYAMDSKLVYMSLSSPTWKDMGRGESKNLARLSSTSKRLNRISAPYLYRNLPKPITIDRLVHTLLNNRNYRKHVQRLSVGDWVKVDHRTFAQTDAYNLGFERYGLVNLPGTITAVLAGHPEEGWSDPSLLRPRLSALALCCAGNLRHLKLSTFAGEFPVAVRPPVFSQLQSISFCNENPHDRGDNVVSANFLDNYPSVAGYQWILDAAPNLQVLCFSKKSGLEELFSRSVSTLVLHNCHITENNMDKIVENFHRLSSLTYHNSRWNLYSGIITPQALVESLERYQKHLKYFHGSLDMRYGPGGHYTSMNVDTFKLDVLLGDCIGSDAMEGIFLLALPETMTKFVLGFQENVHTYLPALADDLAQGSAVEEVIITVRERLDDARIQLDFLHEVCPEVRWRLYRESALQPYWAEAEMAIKYPGVSPWQ